MSFGVALRNGVAFALGTVPSMTSGSGRIPSLNLNFLGNTLDPAVTFSRGTQATRFASDGTLQYAPHNLLTYSRQFDNAAWTKSNSFVQTNLLLYSQDFDNANWSTVNVATPTANTTIAPDGTLTADTLTCSAGTASHNLQQVTTITGTPVTFSVYMKAGTYSSIQIFHGSLLTTYANFNLSNGTLGTVGAAFTASITPAANGFYRCTVTFTPTAFSAFRIAFISSATGAYNESWTAAGTETVFLWGAQLVQGSVPGDYVATTSAALPVLYSSWDGSVTARKLCEDAATASHLLLRNPITLGVSCTLSEYFKAGERGYVLFGNTEHCISVNLSAGTASSAFGSPTSITCLSVGNGWYRASFTATFATDNGYYAWVSPNGVFATRSYAGDGSSGIYIADAQLAQGPYPLDYTLTTTAAVYGARLDYDPTTLATQNLLTYSNAFSNVVWGAGDATHVISANSVLAPDGSVTGSVWTFPASSAAFGYNTQIITSTNANLALTFSVWARIQSGTKNIKLRISNVTIATVSSADITLTTTWQRISYSITAGTLASTSQIGVGFYLAASNSLVAGDLVELYGAQLNTGSTALPYLATTTTAISNYTPRGLLVEEQRTNLATYSNTFSDASWVALGTKNVVASASLSPEGIANAWTLTDGSAVAFDGIQKAITVAVDSNTYTASLFILKTTGGTSTTFGINFAISGGTLVSNNVRINTDTGAVLAGTATVTNSGSCWRVSGSLTNNSTVGNVNMTISLYPATAAYNSATDTAAATGSATIYGAQVELGAFATSYIPTLASQLTRNADSAILTVGSWFNPLAGTIFAQSLINAKSPNSYGIYALDDSTTNNVFNSFYTAGLLANSRVSGATVFTTSTSVGASLGVYKEAFAFANADYAVSFNGGAPTTQLSGAIPTGINRLQIGAYAGVQANGWIQVLQVYPRRLPNTQLQSLTA